MEALGIDPARRPQTLTVAEYVTIANQVAAYESASADNDRQGGDEGVSGLEIEVSVTPEFS